MKIKYDAVKRSRIKRQFMGFTTYDQDWWFDYNTNSWALRPDVGEMGYSSHQYCRTVRAFRRKLKKAPNGVVFVLESRWVGYNVVGFGSKKKTALGGLCKTQ